MSRTTKARAPWAARDRDSDRDRDPGPVCLPKKADRHKSRAHTKELTHIKTLHWLTHLQISILGHLHIWTFAYNI